jgi:purine-binding chemotaxis protein CheW
LKAQASSRDEAEVLRLRAAQLARPVAPGTAGAAALRMLDFAIGAQRCLLELSWLREVRPLRELLAIPGAPPPLLGLVPLRGQMLPVIDVFDLLGIVRGPGGGARRLLVLGGHTPAFGIAATEVHGLQELAAGEAERRSQALDNLRPDLVRGVTREGHLVLDGRRLLALQPGAVSTTINPDD